MWAGAKCAVDLMVETEIRQDAAIGHFSFSIVMHQRLIPLEKPSAANFSSTGAQIVSKFYMIKSYKIFCTGTFISHG